MAQATQPLEVRTRLREALELDLIGPWKGHSLADERLPGWVRPSNWYLTGFLVPRGTPPAQRADADSDDDFQSEVAEDGGLGDDSSEDREAAKKGFFPSSMGLSFLVAEGVEALEVIVRWGDYRYVEGDRIDGGGDENASDTERADRPVEGTNEGQGSDAPQEPGDGAAVKRGQASSWWQRTPREEPVPMVLPLTGESKRYAVPDSNGLTLHVVARLVETVSFSGRIAPGTRSVSLFLVNERTAKLEHLDEVFAFQAEIEVSASSPFVPRPDPRPVTGGDWDERVADLHYAGTPEYAVGHGVSADWELVDGACGRLRTTWTPCAEVEKTETFDIPGVELAMDALGELSDGAAAQRALTALVVGYRSWIEEERNGLADLAGERREVAEELLRLTGIAADRIQRGIRLLAQDEDALDAFRMANRAVAAALSRRLARAGVNERPRWRAFQLAFLLLNLPGLADPAEPEREVVDLLFFPTGGGKTEAYLGLAAFTMVLRRLRNPGEQGRVGAGVSVIMRYTLRLLTLDQLGRAASLVCALELERRKDVARYGGWPFEIGLWVGKAGTPNRLGRKGDGRSDSARSLVRQYKNNPSGRPSPIPLESCPWCGEGFSPDSFELKPDDDRPTDLRIACANWECDFSGNSPLPIIAVDEPLYRRLPAFLIATVDKFASLPWVGESGVLLGGADRYNDSGFYGAAEPGQGKPLARPLLPPDLVIQDELHLISGPLGTMAGLYEAVIEALCQRDRDGKQVKPKIVASTATVRHAGEQIQGLFGRPITQIFPPPGPGRRDSFFAVTKRASERPARQYIGVAAQGRNPKEAMRRVLLALMGAAERAWRAAGGPRNHDNPADAYMTVLGYFNSLRELGGARRILEEEVQNTLKRYGDRKRLGESQGLFRDRTRFSDVVELTSRVSTDRVADARRRLQQPFHEKQRVDCAIATNMISVGLDIQRLGLMLVYGQPKTNSEYIQATSRVGRDDRRPGLVVTLYNVHRPRDRSHYERFRHYHETFYRSVEVASVTPFAARALDHGFAGALVALARHARGVMTPADGVEEIGTERAALERLLLQVFRERVNGQPLQDEDERNERLRSVQDRIGDLLDSWHKIYDDYRADGVPMQYQQYERRPRRPLLREMLDADFESPHHAKFRANRSLRDVEPQVNLYLKELPGRLSGGGT